MKYSNLRAFEKHLEGAAQHHFSPVYLIACSDSYQREEAVDILNKRLLCNISDRSLALKTFSADSVSFASLFDELDTMGFLVEKRIVLVNQADKAGKQVADGLLNYIERPNKGTYLVLVCNSIKKNTKLYKSAEKAGVILDIPEEKPWQKEKTMVSWIIEHVGKEGKRIDPHAAQHLIHQLGTDQALLNNEILKLVCYVGDRPMINMDDVCAVSTSINIEDGWKLGEAVFKRDVKGALRISKALIDDGVALLVLLRQLRSQFQTDFEVCCILKNGGNANDVAKEFPYMKGFILERHVTMARHYGMESFKKGILAIDDTELQAKNSVMDDSFLAERLIVKITTE
ncbi:MAG: DNA polymerase III subunit delta [Chlamydiia bacterium]|nr:DNA polymerase III subunit delta [Chlamydiia bacterium]